MINVFLTLITSLIICSVYLFLAKKSNWLDYPNSRSAHQMPVPSGGGIAIFLTFCVALVWFNDQIQAEVLSSQILFLLMLLTALGFLDDIYELKIFFRLLIYFIICWIAILNYVFTNFVFLVSHLQIIVISFFLCFFINLYNFMDGIDGLLSTNTVLVSCCAILLLVNQEDTRNLIFIFSVLASAHVGFLFLNWAPAKLFMGDAGSIPTGFLLGVMAIESSQRGFISLSAWLILFSPFLSDSLSTLFFRFYRSENIFQPHNSHFYQRLARRWRSHQRVVFAFAIIQCGWCFPLAYLALLYPQQEINFLLLAYIPSFLVLVNSRGLA